MRTRYLPTLLILLGLLLLPLGAPFASGDGTPIVPIDIHSTLRENRQLAYITTDGENQTMELFVNIVSLDPGENLTWLVPLRTEPTEISVHESTDREFREKHDMEELFREGERQNEGCSKVSRLVTGEVGARVTGYLFTGFFTWFYVSSFQYMSSEAAEAVYQDQGFSVHLRSFENQSSVENYYRSLNLSLPEQVKKTLEAYGSFSLATIDLTTQAPIPEENFTRLQERAPLSMKRLRDFVANHSTIEVDRNHFPSQFLEMGVQDPELRALYNELREELEDDEKFYQILQDFSYLVRAIYGYSEMRGYTLKVTQPLFQGKAFFPLGTTPSWSASGKIEVIFECDENNVLDFKHHEQYQAFKGGKHYYLWGFENEAPGYDLEGEYGEENTVWQRRWYGFNGKVHDHATPLAYLVCLLLYYLGGLLVILGCQKIFLESLDLGTAVRIMCLFFLISLGISPLFFPLMLLLGAQIDDWLSTPVKARSLEKKQQKPEEIGRTVAKQYFILATPLITTLLLIHDSIMADVFTFCLASLALLGLGTLAFHFTEYELPFLMKRQKRKTWFQQDRLLFPKIVEGIKWSFLISFMLGYSLVALPGIGFVFHEIADSGGSDNVDTWHLAFVTFLVLSPFFILLAMEIWRARESNQGTDLVKRRGEPPRQSPGNAAREQAENIS